MIIQLLFLYEDKMARVSKKGYIDNATLRKWIIEYNDTNIEDTGDWVDGYIDRQTKKFEKKRMNEEAYNASMSFAKNTKEKIAARLAAYDAMSPADKTKHDIQFEKVRSDLFIAFNKIAQGRIASLRLKRQLKDIDEIYDIGINAVLSVFRYINRYDPTRNSSAFSYVTQLAHNAIIQQVKNITLRNKQYVTGLDYFENLNTIDNPRAVMSGANRLMDE